MIKTSQNKANKTNQRNNARQAQKPNLDIDDMSLYVFEDECSTISPSQKNNCIFQVTGRDGQAGKYAHVN